MIPSIEPSQFVLEHAPWSISKANTAQQCPHRFYLQYVKKAVLSPKPYNWEQTQGNAVHKLLEYLMEGHPEEQCHPAVEKEFQFTTNEREMYFNFVPAVKTFVSRYKAYKERYAVKSTNIEFRLAVDLEGNVLPFFNNKGFLRGVIDVAALFRDKPDALIIDHKTGKRNPIEYWQETFNAYALLLKAKEPQLENIKIGVHFVRDAEIEFVDKLMDVRDVQKLFDNLIRFLNKATELTPNYQLVRPSGLCDYCDYRRLCSAQADGTNGKKIQQQQQQGDTEVQSSATLDTH